jgi:tRNA threonylcarbamoyladenosine biosynthesis protein TsaB
MLLLAMDTSTPAVTVALHDGCSVPAAHTTVDAMRHAEVLAPAIETVLTEAGVSRSDLTGVVVGVGPGPFTGLRVGLVTARVLGAALGIPVQGVCSLDVVAAGADRSHLAGPYAVATDARRREVYWATYGADGRRVSGPVVGRAAELAAAPAPGGGANRDLPVAGTGPGLYPDDLPLRIDPEYPRAADLATAVLAGTVELLDPAPLYLRRPDARPPGPRKPVLSR